MTKLIKIEKAETSYLVQPEDQLNKTNLSKAMEETPIMAGAKCHPYDEKDVEAWKAIVGSGYRMELGNKGFTVYHNDKVIGQAGIAGGAAMTNSDLRNFFKQCLITAEMHQKVLASRAVRDGVAPSFLNEDVWGDMGVVPDNTQITNNLDIHPFDKLTEEINVPVTANGGEGALKSIQFTEEDLLAKSEPMGQNNQGWVKK